MWAIFLGVCYGQSVIDIGTLLAQTVATNLVNSIPDAVPLPALNSTTVRAKAGAEMDARYYFSYATLSYCNSSAIQAWKCRDCHELGPGWEVQDVIQDLQLESQAVIAANHLRKEIVIGVRGTRGLNNNIQDLLIEQVPFGPPEKEIKVHLGFRNIAAGLLPAMLQATKTLLNREKTRNYKIAMAGHSMGGAVAVLSSLTLQRELNIPWSRFHIYTYGQPRVGNLAFVHHYNSLPLTITRVVNENDVVPHIPLNLQGYFHTLHELYLHNSVSKKCSSLLVEDEVCSRSRKKDLSKDPHDFAWDKAYSDVNCLPYPS